MKKLFWVTLLFAVMIGTQGAMGQVVAPKYEDAVQVNGKAERKVTPDEIYVAVTIKDGDTKGQSVNQLESRFKSELTAMGVDVAANLKVTSQNLTPRKKNAADSRRSYELKLADVWTLGSVFELLGDMGVMDARVTRVSHSQMETFREETRIEAVKNARAIATTLAGAIGQSIGAAVWIIDSGAYETSPVPMMKVRGLAYATSADTVYNEGTAEQGVDMQDITLTYNVSAKFVLNYE